MLAGGLSGAASSPWKLVPGNVQPAAERVPLRPLLLALRGGADG